MPLKLLGRGESMNRWFGSVRQGVAAVGSAFVTAGSLALDASDTWSGVPWQLIAAGGFIVFAAVLLWRINQLTDPPVMAEVRWDRQQPGEKPFACAAPEDGPTVVTATVTGRVWALEAVTLDQLGVIFQVSRFGWLPTRIGARLPKRDVCWGTIGPIWEEIHGPVAGKRLSAGDQIDLDKRLFSYWDKNPGFREGGEIYAKFRVAVRAPHRTLTKRIVGKAE